MGSLNCKEYTTTKDDGSCTTPNNNGTVGTYQSTCETSDMSVYTEYVTICNADDIQENEMKSFDFDEKTKVLLIKQNGKLSAIGNKCTHYGAPLHTGTLGDNRVRCPWHGACFNIKTGDIEDFPGLDSLPCYNVQIDCDGKVKVRTKQKDLEQNKRLKDMVKRCPDNDTTYVIVGGGPAGGVCVETLRQEGFTGRIVLISRENYLPYDRVKVSKALNLNIESIQFRKAEFYEEYGIETLLGVEVTQLDASNRVVQCSNGFSIKFDKIFIASGSRASVPPIKGADLRNIFTVREFADGNKIADLLNSNLNVVCLGSSFIALETAALLNGKAKSVTLIGRENVPLKASFGEQIGQRVLELFEEKNVRMLMNSGIIEIIGNSNGEVSEVVLKNGDRIPCDLLIMGTGSKLNTDFLQGSTVDLNANGSVNTDMHLMTNIPGIYAGGDIANAPVYSIGNEGANIGHYQLAQYHGRIAALNMTGTVEKLQAVPFFFTMLFGKGFRYSGYGKYNDIYIDGDLAELKFAAYFLDSENNVIAVASSGRDPIVAQFAELQTQGKRLHLNDIKDQADPIAWTQKLKARL